MSWLYSINHPTPRYMCCLYNTVQHTLKTSYNTIPSLLKEFTSLLWAQNFWKKISKRVEKLCRKIVTRIRVWARIELFYTNTNHSHYFCTVPRGTPHRTRIRIILITIRVPAHTHQYSANAQKFPIFVLFHVEHRTNTVQHAPKQCSTRRATRRAARRAARRDTRRDTRRAAHAPKFPLLYCSTWNIAPIQCTTHQNSATVHQNSAAHARRATKSHEEPHARTKSARRATKSTAPNTNTNHSHYYSRSRSHAQPRHTHEEHTHEEPHEEPRRAHVLRIVLRD